MKWMIFILLSLTLSVNGQMQVGQKKPLIVRRDNARLNNVIQSKINGLVSDTIPLTVVDTMPVVKYGKTENYVREPACYINGKFFANISLKTVNPMVIDSLHIERKEINIENKEYYGQIFIELKKGYSPKFISLNDLARKYTNLKNGLTIFMVDNDIIKGDYDQYLVDEKYILEIMVDVVAMEKEKTNINVVRLLTKSKENIKKSKQIMIK